MKKILFSVMALGVAGVIAIYTTQAYFSDVETSSGNTFTAGKLDLKVGDDCTYNGQEVTDCNWSETDLSDQLFFNYNDVKPGDYGENTIHLKAEDNDAWLCGYVQNLVNAENECTEPEGKIDSTCGEGPVGLGFGELQNYIHVKIWEDENCNNILDTFIPNASCNSTVPGEQSFCSGIYEQESCDGAGGNPHYCSWSSLPPIPTETVLYDGLIGSSNGVLPLFTPGINNGEKMVGEQEYCLGVSWMVDENAGNDIQSDSVAGDVTFYIEQVRNNPNFTCPQEIPGQ